MKLRIVGSILLILVVSAGMSTSAFAGPWHRYHRHYGYYPHYYRPHATVEVRTPAVVVESGNHGGYKSYGSYYYNRPHHYAPRYYGRRYEYRRWR